VYTSLATAKTVTGISNATEAVVSCVAHGYSAGDVIFITSGWGRVHRRAFRIKTILTDSFVLEGMDTTNTEFFPTGGGAGTAAKAQTPVQMTQILSSTTSGGDAQTVEYSYEDSDARFSINDGFSAVNRVFELDADAIGSPGYTLAKTLTSTGIETVLKSITKGGSFTLTPGTLALNEEVVTQDGQVNRVRLAFNGSNQSVRYAS
jgi:hypothetical protein